MRPTGKDETPRKTAAAAQPQELPLKCPRCDSLNTKFCYYNNYSLAQPRHFCKTCRRYWTKGGALRTVPIGGGCRKNKKITSSPPLSAQASGLKFFQGISPAMDFNHLDFNHFAAGPSNIVAAAYDLDCSINREMGLRSSLVSSIESLSSINQDLHWKMQKQRLAMLLPGDDGKNCSSGERKPPQPIMFENVEVSPSKHESGGIKSPRKDSGGGVGNISTEWFFDNSYATPATSNVVAIDNSGGWSSGIQAWCDLTQ